MHALDDDNAHLFVHPFHSLMKKKKDTSNGTEALAPARSSKKHGGATRRKA
jgi:hypothetical protein